MPIDEQLLTVLACPGDDHSPLESGQDAEGHEVLICTGCRSTFPIRDGIPVLLVTDAIPGPNGVGVLVSDGL
jgi:uncharacterized protein YbaR (Trm112 family)